MSKFEAIIWDCDGVLMDSEILACKTSANFLTELGYPITIDEYLNEYLGKGFRDLVRDVEKKIGKGFFKQDIVDKKNERRRSVFEKELKAIDGIHEVLEQIDLPMCIASGSGMERLEHSLKIVDLFETFKKKIFSAELVENGKPAPDIFLYAAEKLGVDPKKCLVIEDGKHGTVAAVRAGMTVYGFTGGSHMNSERIQMLKDAGAEPLFSDMKKLLELI